MATWIQIPFSMPTNNQVVWVRTERWSGAPFLAQYKTNNDTFVSSDNSLAYPFYAISHWHAQ